MIMMKGIEEYITENDPIKTILSDNGVQFSSNLWNNYWAEKGVTTRHTSPYTPSSNSVERVMGTIGECIRIFCAQKQKKWAELQCLLCLVYHHAVSSKSY